MVLESPFLRKQRSDDEVAADSGGAAPTPDRFEQSRRQGNIGRVGASIARAVSGFNDTLNQRQSTFQNAMRTNSERQATLYQQRTGQPLRPAPASPPAAPPVAVPPTRQPVAATPTLARPATAGAPAQGAATTTDTGSRVVGSFNGRTITQADADALAQKLPTSSGPVVMGPNGSYAAASGAAPGRVATTAPNAPVNATSVQAPTLVMPRTLSGDLEGAEKERQARLGDIDSAMFGLRGRLNSRGRRDLYATLIGQQNQLTRDRVNQVTGLETEGARLANAGAIEQARLGTQVGEGNANRALRSQEVATDATLKREATAAAALRPMVTLRSEHGATSLLRNDGTLTPLVGADGTPFREAVTDGSTVTDATLFDAYRKDLATINENALLRPEERTAMLAEVEARPEYQPVLNSIRKPTLQRFLEVARQVNPNATDADLADYYRQQYGQGEG